MLKNLLKSKKFMAAVAIVTTVALGTGGTFAWFYARAPLGLSADMLTTGFTATFDDLGAALLEPGVHQEIDGVLKNTGTTDILIQLDFHPSVTIKSYTEMDLDYPDLEFWGGWLPQADWYVVDRDPNVKITPRAAEWKIEDYVNSSYYTYLRDDDGRLYLLMSGQEAPVEMPFSIDLNGPGMGNKYQGASLSFSKSLFGVGEWWSDDCLQTYFGKTFADFEFVYGIQDGDFGIMSIDAEAQAIHDKIVQRIAETRAAHN